MTESDKTFWQLLELSFEFFGRAVGRAVGRLLRSRAVWALLGLVLLLVPGEFWIRGMAALGGILLGLFFSLAYMPETTENRVKRAGYPAGTAQAARERAAQDREVHEGERRRAAAAKRAARYRARQGH